MISPLVLLIASIVGSLALGATFLALLFRRVVATNEVHIVQSSKKTMSFGKDTENGNTYYEWPSWIPLLGITKVTLPVSVFDLDLDGYEAYDKGRLPFVVDVKAFFRITDSNVAAQRVASFTELREQLQAIVQGAVRTIIASSEIEEIMQGRSRFGEEFTREVSEQLGNWGVATVKNIELMDIRDAAGSPVIQNIMAKKKSHIEMESRTEVARNKKTAEIAEIEAKQEVDLQAQAALQSVGLRRTQTEREVALAQQESVQAVKEQEKTTKEKEMGVLQVERLRTAEIEKQVQVVHAQQGKEIAILQSEGVKETTILVADGDLEAKRRQAEGTLVEGNAKAAAEKAMQLAPVEAQIVLAKEIGTNESYQKYLVTIEQIHAAKDVGVAQAQVLGKAQVKIISNAGDPVGGLTKVMDLFSPSGGTKVGAMLEALSQTDAGSALLAKVGCAVESSPPKHLN